MLSQDKKNIFIISLFIFLIKWFFIIYFNTEIDSVTKIIFNLEDRQYFTLIHNLANLNFNPTYDPDISNSNFIALPIYSIFFHSLFFKLFNIYGFIIIEFFIILSFFYIFIYFFNRLGLGKTEATLLSLLIFCLPSLINYFHLFKIPYASSIVELYNLRIPRPSISHLYLFFLFYILILKNKKNNFNFKELALVGIIFALMWGSYYYNLTASSICFVIYYFYITNGSDQKIFKYVNDFFIVFFFFIIFSIPILLIILNAEPNYLTRVGLIELNLEKKQILLNHFIGKVFSLAYIIIFIVITIFYFLLKRRKEFKIEGINLLYFIFLGSFMAPIIFIIISPTISEIYHFSNMLLALTFFVFLIFSFLIILTFSKKNIFLNKNLFKIFIIFLLSFYFFYNFTLNKGNSLETQKIHTNELMSKIKKINIKKDSEILTFDGDVQINLILNNYSNLSFVIGINTAANDETIENKVINIFNFLSLDENEFLTFISNKKRGWRYMNNNIGKTFYMKYQANNLTSYKDSIDFLPDELKFISNSSPLHSQQLIIPIFEIKRLINKFTNFTDQKKINPKLIIINLNDNVTKNLFLSDELYCIKKINKTYKIYYNRDISPGCLL